MASEAGDMARLLGEIFSRRNPPAYSVALMLSEFEAFARLLRPKAVTVELTLAARSADTSKLVGVMLTPAIVTAP